MVLNILPIPVEYNFIIITLLICILLDSGLNGFPDIRPVNQLIRSKFLCQILAFVCDRR